MRKHGVNATGRAASGSSGPIQPAAPFQPIPLLLLVLYVGTLVAQLISLAFGRPNGEQEFLPVVLPGVVFLSAVTLPLAGLGIVLDGSSASRISHRNFPLSDFVARSADCRSPWVRPWRKVSYGAGSPFAIGGTILGNSVVGVLYGWCYWRRSLLAAMIAHFSVDVVLHVLPALVRRGTHRAVDNQEEPTRRTSDSIQSPRRAANMERQLSFGDAGSNGAPQ